MTKINKETAEELKKTIFRKADEFGFTSRSRSENGRFMDELVEDPKIGGILSNYIQKQKIRTYIKDGILNQYTKLRKKQILSQDKSETIINTLYNEIVSLIQRENDVYVYRSENNKIFILSEGTELKWETALRKALDAVAKYSNLTINDVPPYICLHLAVINKGIT
jgi:hypothetical protein